MSLTVRAVRGAAITIASGIGSRALGLIGTLVLTYFLHPEEYGEVGVATVVVLTAHQLLTLGFGQYLIAYPKSGRAVAYHAMLYSVGLALVATLAVVLLRNPLGPVFDAPTIGQFIPGLALAGFVDRLSYIPERLLVRDMRFRVLGVARTLGEVIYTIASVGLAAMGLGAQAIVLANIARSLLRSGWMIFALDRREYLTRSPLSWETTRALLRFGIPMAVSTNAAFASRRWDNLLVSRFFGTEVVGHYNLAYNLADIPAVQVGEQIGDVLLPSFAHLEADRKKDALVRSTMLLGLIIFPLAIGLGAVADTLVATFFKPEWRPVGAMLALLSALSVMRPIGWTIGSYLQSQAQTRMVMILEVAKVVLLMLCIMTIGRFGPLWTCTAVGVAFALHALASLSLVRRFEAVRLRDFLRQLLPPLLACGPMVAAVLLVRPLHSGHSWGTKGVGLMLELVVGAVAYVVAAWFIAPNASREFVRLIRSALLRKRAAPAAAEPDVAEVAANTPPTSEVDPPGM